MKKTLLVIMALAMLSVAAWGCIGKAAAYTSGEKITASMNREFTIGLGANTSTGYSWQPAFDSNILTLVKTEYKNGDNANGKIVGAPGVQYFTFKTLEAGQTTIAFTYQRPWEQATPQDKQQSFTITIK